MIEYLLLVSRQGKVYTIYMNYAVDIQFLSGKVRLAKWFTTLPPKTKAKIVKDVTQLVLARRTKMCNFLEYKGMLYPTLPETLAELLKRFENRVQAIRISILCDGYYAERERAHHARGDPPICGSTRQVFRKRTWQSHSSTSLSDKLCVGMRA